MKKLLLLTLCISVVLFACKEDDDEMHTDFDYHVHITSPNADDRQLDDTLHLEIDFESHTGEMVHHVNVRIYNSVSNAEVYNMPADAHVHAETGSYSWNDDVILSAANGFTADSDWVLEAKVWGHDAGMAEQSATVQFHIVP